VHDVDDEDGDVAEAGAPAAEIGERLVPRGVDDQQAGDGPTPRATHSPGTHVPIPEHGSRRQQQWIARSPFSRQASSMRAQRGCWVPCFELRRSADTYLCDSDLRIPPWSCCGPLSRQVRKVSGVHLRPGMGALLPPPLSRSVRAVALVLELHVLVELRRLGQDRLDGEERRADLLRDAPRLVRLHVRPADLVQQLRLPCVHVPRPRPLPPPSPPLLPGWKGHPGDDPFLGGKTNYPGNCKIWVVHNPIIQKKD